MAFLDTLKEIGLGNRGPYGRQISGASNLSNVLRENTARSQNRDVEQAIVAASKQGEIPFEKQVEIADRFGMPLRDVMQRVGPVNKENTSRRLSQMGKTFYQMIQARKKAEPGWKPNEKDAMQMAQKVGATNNEDVAFLMGGLQKAQANKQFIQRDPTRDLTSISGLNEVKTEKKGIPTSGKDQADIAKYKFAEQQFKEGKGEDPGSFTKWSLEQKKAGATNINMGEKLGLHEGKKNIDFKVRVRTPAFKKDAIDIAKSKYTSDEWRDLDMSTREGAIFETTDEMIKEGFGEQKVVFGVKNGVQGWFQLSGKGSKLVLKWEGIVPKKGLR